MSRCMRQCAFQLAAEDIALFVTWLMVSEQAVPWTKYTLTTAIVRSFLRGQQKKACSVMHCSAEAIFRHHRLRLKGSRSEPTTVAAEMRDVVQKSVGSWKQSEPRQCMDWSTRTFVHLGIGAPRMHNNTNTSTTKSHSRRAKVCSYYDVNCMTTKTCFKLRPRRRDRGELQRIRRTTDSHARDVNHSKISEDNVPRDLEQPCDFESI